MRGTRDAASIARPTVLIGGGVGEQSDNHSDPADIVSRIPTALTALCVPGTPACDEDQDGADFPDDCDDRDPARHPGARELPGNTVDEDCDGFLAGKRDRCLAGGSAGQDRRDLDAVRAAMDGACPCANFDGSRGNAGTAYRRCVRDIVKGAQNGGTLRRKCRRLLAQSTCGRPANVICCRERVASGSRSCASVKPTRCISTSRSTRTVETGETNCADTDCTLVLPTTSTTTTTTSTTTTSGPTTTSTTLPPSWQAIHTAVIGPKCGLCHGPVGGGGGLNNLDTCNGGYASLVNVASSELPSRDRVEPGMPTLSWLMIKLDGTQNDFVGQCVGGSCGGPMPANQPQLPPEVRDAIRTWILNGAANDCP